MYEVTFFPSNRFDEMKILSKLKDNICHDSGEIFIVKENSSSDIDEYHILSDCRADDFIFTLCCNPFCKKVYIYSENPKKYVLVANDLKDDNIKIICDYDLWR